MTVLKKKFVLWREHSGNGYLELFPPLCKSFLKTMFSLLKIPVNTHFKNLEVGVKEII